jgi:DHA1 family bicyclomycin/chloramphenicol resistance-like MFS transporter
MTRRPVVRFLDRSTPPHILTLVLIAGLSAMNLGAFLPSLPAMARHFGTEYSVMQLAVSLYLAITAAFQLVIGPVSDRYGRRPVVLWGIGIFILATVASIFAPDVTVFLILRMISGVVVAGMVLSRAVVRDMVPQDEAASMIGYVTMGMALVPMVAPMIGGALDQAFGWQATFAFLAGSGLVIGAITWADMGETASGEGKSFRAQAADYPELFRSPRFWGYAFSAAFASGAFFAFLGGAPYVATEVYGLSAFWSGVGFGAPAIGYMLGNAFSGRFATRFGIDRLILAGALISSAGLLLASALSAIGLGSAWLFFSFCTFVGLGNGLVMPNATAGLLSVRPRLAGTASGLGGAIMIGGGAALSVLAGIVLLRGETDLPLLILMACSTVLSILSILLVIARARRFKATG